MKRTKHILASGLLILSMTACNAAPATTGTTAATTTAAADSLYTPGTYTGQAKGFGGDITVSVTVDSSRITDVQITGDSETDGIGTKAIAEMPQLLTDAQGTNVDSVSGATVTSEAIKTAAGLALNEAMGVSPAAAGEIAMKDGSYTATATSYAEMYGLSTTGSLTMEVTVTDNRITAIDMADFTDTDIIGGMAFDILGEQVISHQSMNLDAVSGATVSSNAFFTALSDCVSQAGADPAVLKAVEIAKAEPQAVSLEADILVIGAGMAGLTAATRAAESGADVILLEKNSVFSSSTTRSLGYIVGAGTKLQQEQGIEDSPEEFFNDIYALYQDEPELDAGLLKKMADDSEDLNVWLTEHGLEFEEVINKSEKGGRATKRIHTTSGGSTVTSVLVKAAEDAGVRIMLGTPAVSLIQEADGAVTGGMATNDNGDEITIKAQATIVCAGSYTNNKELFARLNPQINNIAYESGCGEGDAYTWFTEVGADIVEIPYTQFMYYSYASNFAEIPEVIPNSPDTPVYDILLVTPEGERVTAEDNFCFEFTKENWERGFNEGYAVVDQAFADQYPILMKNVLNNPVPSSGLPFAYQADSIAELAARVGIDPAQLEATVNRYNELCDKGVDDDFAKDAQYMRKLEGSYYIIRLPMVTTDGYTGARINTSSQVLDKTGNWIEGLYAAGSCAVGQTVSVNYFGCGTSLMTCGVFGIAAAEDAVSRLTK